MEMRSMNGGSLKAAGYDERTRKLVIELTSGTFEYSGVSPEIWRRLSLMLPRPPRSTDIAYKEFVRTRVR